VAGSFLAQVTQGGAAEAPHSMCFAGIQAFCDLFAELGLTPALLMFNFWLSEKSIDKGTHVDPN